MDLTRLAELRQIAEAATPGPWSLAGTPEKPCPVVSSHDREHGYQIHSMLHVKDSDPDVWPHMKATYCRDAAHIGAFDPPTVLSLLSSAEDNARLREAIEWAIRMGSMDPDGEIDWTGDIKELLVSYVTRPREEANSAIEELSGVKLENRRLRERVRSLEATAKLCMDNCGCCEDAGPCANCDRLASLLTEK